MQGVFSNAKDIHLFLIMFPHMSLHFKLVPVQYRVYEYGLLTAYASTQNDLLLLPLDLSLLQF